MNGDTEKPPPNLSHNHGGNTQPAEDPSRVQPASFTADLEAGRRQSYSSTTTTASVSEYDVAEDHENDGHRPSIVEMRLSRCRSPTSREGERAMAPGLTSGLERTTTWQSQQVARIRGRNPVPPFSHPLEHEKTSQDYIVDFDGPDDPYRPKKWTLKKKVVTTLLYGLITMSATWASAAYSPGTVQVAQEFHVSREVSVLGTSLYLMGFGVGPLLWAPLSEVYGRRLAVLVPMIVSIAFSFGSATAKDFQTLMLTRFFGAFFASAPVTNTGGVLGDLYSPASRATGIAGYALAVVGGPAIGPIVSAAVVVQPYLGWRWAEYLTGILQSFVIIIGLIYIDETYPPVLLVAKARRLRLQTDNWALHAKFEEWDVTLKYMAQKFLVRPFQILATPIGFLIALYASFCYGILYMQLGSIPYIFQEVRHWKPLPATLPFICILIGCLFGASANTYNQLLYNKAYHAAGKHPVPERRLPPMMVGGCVFSAGQFLTGWTAEPRYHWIAPCIGLVMTGTGFFMIFQAALNYLVDTFTQFAASAVGANTFLRSCFGAAFPLIVRPMYRSIGVGPASCITGGFAALLIPVPFLFFFYGKEVRRRGKWSRESVFD